MELKQRKKIKNKLPKFVGGADGNPVTVPTYSQYWQPSVNNIGSLPTRVQDPGAIPKIPTLSTGQNTNTINGAGYASALQGTVQFANSIDNAFSTSDDPGADDVVNQATRDTHYTMGVGYDTVSDVDRNSRMKKLRGSYRTNTWAAVGAGMGAGAGVGALFGGVGAPIGAVVGGIAGLIGGLSGARHRRRKLERALNLAQRRINNYNQYNRQSALTEGLTQDYYMRNGDTSDDLLYANRGKDLRQPKRR